MAANKSKALLYMTAEPRTTFHKWSILPTELKLMVLSDLLVLSTPIDLDYMATRRSNGSHTSNAISDLFVEEYVHPILNSCNHDLINLAQDVLYSKNQFDMTVRSDGPPRLGKLCADLVRKFHVTLYKCAIPSTVEDTLFRKKDAWTSLLCYENGIND